MIKSSEWMACVTDTAGGQQARRAEAEPHIRNEYSKQKNESNTKTNK
jgi:hypothetical protein